jgi:hypothetical protein
MACEHAPITACRSPATLGSHPGGGAVAWATLRVSVQVTTLGLPSCTSVEYIGGVSERVDWSKGEKHMVARHAITVAWANEALADPDRVWMQPDPASESGHSVRVIGFSPYLEDLLVVILIHPDADRDEQPDGDWWGANAWPANEGNRRDYEEANDEQD